MKNLLKKSGWTDVIVSAIFAIIGILMIVKTDAATKIISYILGGIFIVVGLVKIVDYFIAKGNYDFYNYDLIYGIIAIIIGLITILCGDAIGAMFRIMIGVWIMYSGLIRLTLSLKLHAAKSKTWIVSLLMALLMIACGIYITFTQGAIILTIGIIMVIYSVMNLIESVIFIKNVNEIL